MKVIHVEGVEFNIEDLLALHASGIVSTTEVRVALGLKPLPVPPPLVVDSKPLKYE